MRLLAVDWETDTRHLRDRAVSPRMLPIQMGIAAGISLIVGLLTLLAHVAMIAWTYRDAARRSSHPAFLWALVVFFAPLLGIILYLVFGRNR